MQRSFTALRMTRLLDLDYALPGIGFDLIHAGHDLAGKVEERFAGCGAFSGKHCGAPTVAGFADIGIELDFPKVGNAELLRRLLRATAGENVSQIGRASCRERV